MGFLGDLMKILLDEQANPWEDDKYEKRSKRVTFFITTNMLDVAESQEDLNKAITTYNSLIMILEKRPIDFISSNWNLNYLKKFELATYFLQKLNKKINDSHRRQKLDLLTFLETLRICPDLKYEEFEDFSKKNPEEVPYLKKYLKYKLKYQKLKMKI